MKAEKTKEIIWYEFMATTNLNEVSWAEKIGRALMYAIDCAYGAGFDHRANTILYKQGKEVLQLNEYGHIIQIHPSINTAAKRMSGNASNIRAVIQGRQHTAYGYCWRFKNDIYYKKED